jgi:hypothetical protein
MFFILAPTKQKRISLLGKTIMPKNFTTNRISFLNLGRRGFSDIIFLLKETEYGLEEQGSIPGRYISLHYQGWGPPGLLTNGYHKLFPWGLSIWNMKLTNHFQLL